MSKAVATRKTDEVPAVQQNEPAPILSMLQRIMTDPTVAIDRINQAFDFYQRVEAAEAKKAFDAAMAAAQAEFGPIVKRHLVSFGEGKTSYKHEDLFDIDAVVVPVLSTHGISRRYRGTSKPGEPVSVTCVITHKLGYSEETTLSAGADQSGGKNGIQAIGSTVTYLQRYTLKLALGLSAGRDNDGNSAGAAPRETISEKDAQELAERIKKSSSPAAAMKIIQDRFLVESLSELTAEQHQKVSTWLNDKYKV